MSRVVLAAVGVSSATPAATTISSSTSPLPRLGLGMAALGRPGYINLDRDGTGVGEASVRSVEHMRELAERVMERNLALASSELPWFDCARSYGKSEEFVGTFLRSRDVAPSDVYVSSKWGYEYVADWRVTLEDGAPHEVKDHTVATLLRQLAETRERLGEYVKLYQIHSATFESGVLTNTEVHAALQRCREELGWSIGLSVSGPRQDDLVREAMSVTVPNGDDRVRLFDSVQCTYNLLEQQPGSALTEAHAAGMDIIVKEGMANGRLYRHELLRRLCDDDPTLRSRHTTPDQLALAVVLAQPFRPRVLSGAVTPAHLASNRGAVALADVLSSEPGDDTILTILMAGCRMDSETYWNERAALSWN